jgi:hypothetical protein
MQTHTGAKSTKARVLVLLPSPQEVKERSPMDGTMLSLATRTCIYNNGGPAVLGTSSSLDGTAVAAIQCLVASTDDRKEPIANSPSSSSSSDDSEHEDEETTSSCEASPLYRTCVVVEEERTQQEIIASSMTAVRGDSCPRRVSFSFVRIRQYGITIGDHPLTNMYPLTLDWCYSDDDHEPQLSVDEFERIKDDEGRPRRHNLNAVPSCRGIKAPRLTVNQRIERLVDVTGMNGRELFALERQRQLRVQEESFGHHRRKNQRGLRPAPNR